jgi:hypothetical protein
MSRWEELGAALGDAADRLGTAVNEVAQAMAEVIETGGNQAQDGLDHLANAIREAPLVGGVLGGVLGWLGGVASGVGDLVGAFVVGLGSVITGVLGGALRAIGGMFGGKRRVMRNGLIDVVSGTLGAALVVAGKLVSLLQSSLGIEARKRRLSSDEIRILTQVFRESLAIDGIRIIAGRSGAYRVTDRPFTLGNTIYMKGTGAGDWNQSLVHECTHVWQYQHLGSRYATDALGAQLVLGGDVAYDWQKALPGRWRDFNKEAQAETLEDVYRFAGLVGVSPPGKGAFFDADGVARTGTFVVPPAVLPADLTDEDRGDLASLAAGDFTELAHDAVTTVRSRTSVRRSRRRLGDVTRGRR